MLLAGRIAREVGGRTPVRGVWTVGCGRYAVELYGFSRFVADLDAGRQYGRENDRSLIHSILDWVATEGFFDCYGEDAAGRGFDGWQDAHHYRQRYLLDN
ncbi:hypothetical protein BC2230_11682 [Burkholderia cepacia]